MTGKIVSIVNLKASSKIRLEMIPNILGSNIYKMLLDSSIQGFVFTSISQVLKSLSIMKSYPNISIQYLLCDRFNFLLTDYKDAHTSYLIFGIWVP